MSTKVCHKVRYYFHVRFCILHYLYLGHLVDLRMFNLCNSEHLALEYANSTKYGFPFNILIA